MNLLLLYFFLSPSGANASPAPISVTITGGVDAPTIAGGVDAPTVAGGVD